MSEPSTATAAAPQFSASRLIMVLGVIATLSGLMVVLVYELTRPAIAENRRQAIERAVFEVLPGAVTRHNFRVSEGGVRPADEGSEGILIYAGYRADGTLVGIAAEASAQGYADQILMLYGYRPACHCISGMQVLKLAETPGLGDKIITDSAFQANFTALDAQLDSRGAQLANPIVTVRHGTKRQPWQIDAISGATVSSNAVGRALDRSANELLPKLLPHLAALRQPPPSTDAR